MEQINSIHNGTLNIRMPKEYKKDCYYLRKINPINSLRITHNSNTTVYLTYQI